jgi:large subunit ribosomal protein L15
MKSKVKLLAQGEIKTKINIEVDAASALAKEFVEKLGGTITIIEKKKLDLKLSKKAGV